MAFPILRVLRLRAFRWFGGAAEPRLERVRAIIAEREAQSERLISYVQLAIGLIFLAFYLAAPRPIDASSLLPVPLAIGIFLLLALTRALLGHSNRLGGGILGVLAIADIAVFCGLIWSFHIQYMQPAPFSLKAPSFAFLFVFIALRALRFDVRYVVLTGLSAAVGWTVLTVLAVMEVGTAGITRSFVTYITSADRVLVGAEVDRVITILLVTAILAVAIRRGRGVLVRAVTEETGAAEIRRFLAPAVADAITEAEERVAVGQAEERDAAILVLDLRGFTRFAATRPPGEVAAFLVRFHQRIVPIVEANGGAVDKYLGDGVMATFGAVTPSATAAADALRALDAILAEGRRWRAELEAGGETDIPAVNAAVADGRIVFAALGHEGRLEYTVIGEAVNLCAKIEKLNKDEGTDALVPLATWERGLAQGYRPEAAPDAARACRVAGVDGAVTLVPRCAPAG